MTVGRVSLWYLSAGCRYTAHALTADVHAGEIVQQRLRLIIRHFDGHLGGGLLHIELFATRCSAQYLIQGIHATAAGPTREVRPLKLHRASHGLHRAHDGRSSRQPPITLGTMGLRSGPFAKMGRCDHRLAQAAGEVLAQVPYCLGALRSGGFRLG